MTLVANANWKDYKDHICFDRAGGKFVGVLKSVTFGRRFPEIEPPFFMQREDAGDERVLECDSDGFFEARRLLVCEKVHNSRIESPHDPRNPNSGMVMKKCGMLYEGTLRSSAKNNQGICDACWYALLRSER